MLIGRSTETAEMTAVSATWNPGFWAHSNPRVHDGGFRHVLLQHIPCTCRGAFLTGEDAMSIWFYEEARCANECAAFDC